MSRHDPAVALRQILSHSREAVQLTLGKSRSDLDNDRMLNLALARLLEIIGEAATVSLNKFRHRFHISPGCK